jgi:hypothetical protein
LIGTDVFFHEGAAYGLLIESQPGNPMLAADVLRQRVERMQKGDGVTEEKLKLAERQVSFLSSPDGRVRSFYVADGPYHFVTTSRTLARRFLETASGEGSLGATEEFHYARSLMPVDRKDTIFAYLSHRFFQNLVSPRYRVELVRRAQALADIELLEMARWAGEAEGKTAGSPQDLRDAGLLPRDFGVRPDGSRTVVEGDNVCDSLRGRRGWFVPVPDIDVGRVTTAEEHAYREFAGHYRDKLERLDPIVLAVKRTPLDAGRDRLVIDASMTPLAKRRYSRLREILGEPQSTRLAAVEGDLASIEMVFASTRRFAGLHDSGPPARVAPTALILGGRLAELLVGYVGTTGEIGFLGFLDDQIQGLSDPSGYAGREGGLWRRTVGDFTVFSFYRDVLEAVTPQLRYVEAERPAQIWLRVGDISDAQLTPLLNKVGYRRSRETSLGNLRLMHALHQQLRVPVAECQDVAEELLNADMVCPLGGQYTCRPTDGAARYWTSTALEGSLGSPRRAEVPEGFQSPIVSWLRALEADVRLDEDSLSLHAELEMQVPGRKAK